MDFRVPLFIPFALKVEENGFKQDVMMKFSLS